MILKSFLLGIPLSLCIKIINSVVVVGLYYGFLTTFSIGPSYLFLLRARVMEEGTEKEVSATTGFIAGQLIMFISIYYAPLHLALGRPHTITVLVLPYLLLHFFWNNHKNFFYYGSTTRNSMRNLSIQCVFLNNLIFPFFNHFILPSSTLARLVNIYMFRCNNKMLFVTSSFVGWLIGHILFIKWVGLVLFWIRQNYSLRSNKYLVSELINSMARIFSILLFITCVYYLGRMPSPIVTKKLKEKETSETEEGGERKEESDVETTSETKVPKQEQEGFTEESPVNGKEDEFHFYLYLKEARYQDSPVYEDSDLDTHQDNWEFRRLKEEKKKRYLYLYFWFHWIKKIFLTFFLNYKQCNRPLRYIKNNQLENALRTEMSQFFFFTCTSDGKQIISFTYPPSLSIFFKKIKRKISLYISLYKKKKLYDRDPYNSSYNSWIYTNEKKKCNLNNEFRNRIKVLKKNERPLSLNMVETSTILCDDENEKRCLPKTCDPFFNGPYRGMIKKFYSRAIMNDLIIYRDKENLVEIFWINKPHDLLLYIKYSLELYHQSFLNSTKNFSLDEIFSQYRPSFHFKRCFLLKLKEQKAIDPESQTKSFEFLFDVIPMGTKDQKQKTMKKISIGIEEISKKVPRWSYKLTDDLEEEEEKEEELAEEDHNIRSRRAKVVLIYNGQNSISISSTKSTKSSSNNHQNDDKTEEVALIRYSQQSDFRRNLIKGSIRAQRRKTVIWKIFQVNVHSPLFLDRIDKIYFFSSIKINITEMKNLISKTYIKRERKSQFKIANEETKEEKEKQKKNEENERIEISEAWDTFLFTQAIRGLMLVTQSFLRKFIILPLLIITKNIFRMLFFQLPEWYEDFKEWNREIHIKCTYNGIQLSETEFPKNWLTDGIQIKILYPFRLKPWRKPKIRSTRNKKNTMIKKEEKKTNFCFLTVWGMETDLPFGPPRKRPSFFEPIYKELEKRNGKLQKNILQVIKSSKERIKFSLEVFKKKTRWVLKIVLVIKLIIKKLEKINPILLFDLRKEKVYEPNEKEKVFKKKKKILRESSVIIRPMNWFNYLLIEKKIKDLSDRTIKIRKKIEQTAKDKNEIILIFDNKRSESKKQIFKILKSKNIRLMRKSHYFFKSFIEKIYINILLCTINKINAQPFFESTKRIFQKYIYNKERNKKKEEIFEKNENTMNFIFTIKKSFPNTDDTENRNPNPNFYWNLSYLSQAYVFYKLSQTQLFMKFLSKSHLRPVFQYQGRYPFFKDKLKDYCMIYGIFDSKSRNKKIHTYEWKNWLKGHYQYDFSQKWRNKINRMIQNKESIQLFLYKKKKEQFIPSMKKNDYATDSLMSQKDKWKKHYRYNLLSYKYIYPENSYLYLYGSTLSTLKVNEAQEIPYQFNKLRLKPELFYVLVSMPSNHYLEKEYLIDRNKNGDRKYLDWRILHSCFRKNIEIYTNTHIGIKIKKNIKTEIRSFSIDQEIKPSNQKRFFFDCLGMNQERFYDTISNNDTIVYLEPWFFSEFVLPSNVYKMPPWNIPIKSLFFNFHRNEKSKNIKVNSKKNLHIHISYKKKKLELGNLNQKKNKQRNLESNLRKQKKKKTFDEHYTRSKIEMNKDRKKKQYQYKKKQEIKLNSFLKKYLLFQLKWADTLNQRLMDNIRTYCLLLRLRNPKEIAISSIQRGEINLDEIFFQKNLILTEFIRKGILIIEPIRLSIRRDEKSILYQTMDILLVYKYKKKHQTNERYKKKRYIDKGEVEKSIVPYRNIFVSVNKNHYDFLFPENLLSPRRRREFRIRIYFNPQTWNVAYRNPRFYNENKIRNCEQFLNENKHINTDAKRFIKFKLFLWSNYQLEDLACMNRYWFDTNNSTRFSMSRIHMYSQFRMNSIQMKNYQIYN
uniref:Protein TIC 214 n=3 Tax=Apostasia TaxID=49693 RepID=A0A3G1V8X3_9ASPA|nr:Ycf1 [Apostasia shenzhenica]AYJ83745.1 Ycf1 [Apostasia shenzhenica]QGW13160.1 hypothetical chloroplast RF1 [Apostasia shenzhenica]